MSGEKMYPMTMDQMAAYWKRQQKIEGSVYPVMGWKNEREAVVVLAANHPFQNDDTWKWPFIFWLLIFDFTRSRERAYLLKTYLKQSDGVPIDDGKRVSFLSRTWLIRDKYPNLYGSDERIEEDNVGAVIE